jgi:hypothetical protein
MRATNASGRSREESGEAHMGYYIRILATSDGHIPYDGLRASVNAEHPTATLALEEGSKTAWKRLLLRRPDGTVISLVERNSIDDELGAAEMQEFRDELADCNPQTGREWLFDYFGRVRVIYSFQLVGNTEIGNGWAIFRSLQNAVWQETTGIIQADGEGFSNEEGYHILWQFSDSVKGNWWMGVLQEGSWVHFEMDLGNPRHREAFLAGEVPEGAVRK